MQTQSTIAENLKRVEERIQKACERAGRSRDDVQLVAVVKKRPLDQVRQLHELGPNHFAENRPQELRKRIPEVPGDITWHFVGHLQTNKAKYLPGLVQWVHSVDRVDAAKALQKAWDKHPGLPAVKVCLQFNLSGEEQKHGAGEEQALELLTAALELPRLDIQGLMCMAPYTGGPEQTRSVFRRLRELRDHLSHRAGLSLPQLSMGMTNDFEQAILEGSTMVRIGTALFEE